MKLYASAAPAVVLGEIIYSTVNLITLHELYFHVWKGVWVGIALLLQVQNIRAAEVKVKMGFLNMVVSSSVFSIFLSTPLLSVCFSSWCVCSAVCSLENLATCIRLGVQEKLSVAQSCSSAFEVALSICRYLTICPVHLWIFCFPFPLFLLQLSERARERKVPVTRIGRLANFGGQFAHPHL